MTLDLTALNNACSRFEEGLTVLTTCPADSLVRDGVIQRFEFTYEIAHKMLRRYLEMTVASPDEIRQMAFPDLIRTGAEHALLLNGWDRWKEFRQARTDTSHSYNEAKALAVIAPLPSFLLEARFLRVRLLDRTAPA